MNKIFILIGFFLITTTSKAQQNQTYKFTLEEAINFAIDSNYSAINARKDIAIAIKKKWETTASGLPQLNGSVSYQNNIKQPTTLLPGEITGADPGTFVPVIFGTKESANIGVSLSQLIFDGSYLSWFTGC